MRYVATVAETRAADAAAAARMGEAALIGRASFGVAVECARLLGSVYGARVCILAGSGHNAADALAAGQQLRRWGATVVVVRSSEHDGDELWAAAARDLPVVAAIPTCDLVIDGMTGVGFSGELRGRAAALVGDLGDALVVAVDVPSGVAADDGGVPGPAVRADVTVTFDRLKVGHVAGAGADLAGAVVVVPVGLDFPASLPTAVLDADDVAELVPTPDARADKYSRGVVGVVAGSERYPGAAILCAGGAVRGGAGYVRYEGHAADAVRAAWPTVVVGDGRVDAYVCGSGSPSDDDVRRVVSSDVAAVLDAGALSLGADVLRGRRAPTLITPHAGEFERLTGVDPSSDPLGSARRAAADLGVHVLLKGQHTVVAAPDGRALINPTGSTWLSTAGTGDVLAGAAGALLAAAVKRGDPDVLLVGAAAAFLHGLAGSLARVPLAANDLLDTWADAVTAVRS
ncbi:MAG TPA: bifunctional ADP-dependent NAD(P)H-hydrate dehydratase/NAD(P)H-hydrate epimerase [Mycobacteriales bacterium]